MRSRLTHPHPTLRRMTVQLLAVVLLVTGAGFREAADPPPVVADHCLPGQVHVGGDCLGDIAACPLGQVPYDYHGQRICVRNTPFGTAYLPAPLLNRDKLADATVAQRAALQRLEVQAVTTLLQNRGIPTTEFASAQTWGRSDALAELWALMLEAMFTPPCDIALEGVTCRTADQQLVSDWMNEFFRSEFRRDAEQAGREYVDWAGLDPSAFDALLTQSPDRGQLTGFLDDQPVPRTSDGQGGWCAYFPPAVDGITYTGRDDPLCFQPCPSILGCDPPYPPSDHFVAWGKGRRAADTQADARGLAENFQAVTLGLAGGGAAAAAASAGGLYASLAGVMAQSAFQVAVFPFAAQVSHVAVTVPAGAFAPATAGEAAALANAGPIAASGVATIVGVVIFFTAVTATRIFQLVTQAELPGKLADYIVSARESNFDVGVVALTFQGIADFSTDLQQRRAWQEAADNLLGRAYLTFLDSAQPAPLAGERCENLGPGPDCLNAPAVPAPVPGDLSFVVDGSTVSNSIEILGQDGAGNGFPNTVRLHGPWFVQSFGGQTVQSLRLHYTHADFIDGEFQHRSNVTWLVKRPSGRYMFVGVSSNAGCVTGTCVFELPAHCGDEDRCQSSNFITWQSPVIEYVGADGQVHTARVRSSAALTWPAPAPIDYGTPVTAAQLNATASAPGIPLAELPIAGTFSYRVDGVPVTASDNLVLDSGVHTLSVTFTPDGASAIHVGPATASVPFFVDKSVLTVTAPDISLVYGDAIPSIEPRYDGFRNGDDEDDLQVAARCSTTATNRSLVGTYPVTCGAGLADNYGFSYVDGTATVRARDLQVLAGTYEVTYGEPVPKVLPSYQGFAGGDGPHVGLTLPTCDSDVGPNPPARTSYETRCSGGDFPNYTLHHHPGQITIAPRELLIMAPNASKIYGEEPPLDGLPVVLGGEGLATGDTLEGVVLTSAGAAATAPVAGSPYSITASDAFGVGLSNYEISYVAGSLQVRPASLIVTADDRAKTYGELVSFAVSEFNTMGLRNDDAVTAVTLQSEGAAATAGVTATPYAIWPSAAQGRGLDNYDISYVMGAMVVDPAPLTITASSADVTLGAVVPPIAPHYSGFVNAEGPDDLGVVAACSTTATAGSQVGTYVSSCSGAGSPNYLISYVNGIVNITYAISAQYDGSAARKGGATVPIRITILDAAGRNISSASIAVTLANPAVDPNPAPGAQPTGVFRFVADGPHYQYDLKTTKYPRGTYRLTFVVAGDPLSHTVTFTIR